MPFTPAHPDEYTVTVVNGSVATLDCGADYDVNFLDPFGHVELPPVPKAPISRLEFLNRIPAAKRIAIRAYALTDPILSDALNLFDAAQFIRTDLPQTIQLVGYLAAKGLISADDYTSILA